MEKGKHGRADVLCLSPLIEKCHFSESLGEEDEWVCWEWEDPGELGVSWTLLCCSTPSGTGSHYFWLLAGEGCESLRQQWSFLPWKDKKNHQPQADSCLEASQEELPAARESAEETTLLSLASSWPRSMTNISRRDFFFPGLSETCQRRHTSGNYASPLFQSHPRETVTLQSLKVASGPALPETTYNCWPAWAKASAGEGPCWCPDMQQVQTDVRDGGLHADSKYLEEKWRKPFRWNFTLSIWQNFPWNRCRATFGFRCGIVWALFWKACTTVIPTYYCATLWVKGI